MHTFAFGEVAHPLSLPRKLPPPRPYACTHSHVVHTCLKACFRRVIASAYVRVCVRILPHACACAFCALHLPFSELSSVDRAEDPGRKVAIKESSYFASARKATARPSILPHLRFFPLQFRFQGRAVTRIIAPPTTRFSVFNGLINARGVIQAGEG